MTLWAAVALVLARGVGDLLAGPQQPARQATARLAVTQFPDGEARAVAVAFSRSYLTIEPGRSARRDARVSVWLGQGLSDQAAPVVPRRSPGAWVADATVAREVPLGGSRALITVANFMRGGGVRYLTVPVARDQDGSLSVYDLPSFSAPPAAGESSVPVVAPLSGRDGEAVADLAGRFLRAYLHGEDESALAYFLAPGVNIASMGAGLAVEEIEEVDRLGAAPAGGMQLSVLARVRDEGSGVSFRQRYRLTVERAGRWYVTAIAGGPRA